MLGSGARKEWERLFGERERWGWGHRRSMGRQREKQEEGVVRKCPYSEGSERGTVRGGVVVEQEYYICSVSNNY